MHRRGFLAAAAVSAVAPASALARTLGGGLVALVTADLEAHVAAVEIRSGRVVRRIATAPGPRSIESSPFGYALVAHTASGRVSLLDAATLSVEAVLEGFDEPRYTAMHAADRLAYVTDSGRAEVVTVDVARHAIVHRTRVPGPARHVSVDAAGRYLWTALGTTAERVAVLDLADRRRPRLRWTFAPPFLAHDVVVAPGGRHVWITSGSRRAIAVYRSAGGRPQLLAADAPPQHVAFTGNRVLVTSGVDGTLRVHRSGGAPLRTERVPRGSYNVTYAPSGPRAIAPAAVAPSLDRGTVCVLAPDGTVRFVRRVARSAHDACIVLAG